MDIFEKDLSGAMVLPGVRIGYGSIVGANSVVTHDVPPMTIVGGNPARFIKRIEVASGGSIV